MVSELTGRRAGFTTPQIPPAAYELAHGRGCLLELSVGLALLTGRSLVGSARSGALLLDEPDWPMAWRARARMLHEGLAAGCVDDLDLVLGIVAESDRGDDPSSWCATWWVNETAISAAQRTAEELIELFGDGATISKQIDLGNAIVVRSVLAETVRAPIYEPAGPGTYRLPTEDDKEAIEIGLSGAALLDPQIPVLAFGADRHDDGTYDIGRLVAAGAGTARTQPWHASARDLRARVPVGTVIRATVSGTDGDSTSARELHVVRAGMPAPGAPSAPHVSPGRVDIDGSVAVLMAASDTHDADRFLVIGYTPASDDRPALVLRPTVEDAPLDPAADPSIGVGDPLVVEPGRRESLGNGHVFTVRDGRGVHFYVPEAAGLSVHDHDFLPRLEPGTALDALAVPDAGSGHLTVTLRPGLWQELAAEAPEGEIWHAARLVDSSGAGAIVDVATNAGRRIVHRFAFPAEQLADLSGIAEGDVVDVRLAPGPCPLPVPEDADVAGVVESHPGVFARRGDDWIAIVPPPLEMIAELEALEPTDRWRRALWRWFDQAHILEVVEARPPAFGSPEPEHAEPDSAGASAGVGFDGHESDGARHTAVHHAGPDDGAIEPTHEEPAAAVDPTGPLVVSKMTLRIPEDAVHRLADGNGALAALLAGATGALVALEGTVVTIEAAEPREIRVVLATLRRNILPARGTLGLSDPTPEIAARIEDLCRESESEIVFADDLGSAELSAPTITELRDLLARIEGGEPGTTGSVTSFADVEILEERADAIPTLRAEPPAGGVDVEPALDAAGTTTVEETVHIAPDTDVLLVDRPTDQPFDWDEGEATPDATAVDTDDQPSGRHEDEATPDDVAVVADDEPTGWQEEAQTTSDDSAVRADDGLTGWDEGKAAERVEPAAAGIDERTGSEDGAQTTSDDVVAGTDHGPTGWKEEEATPDVLVGAGIDTGTRAIDTAPDADTFQIDQPADAPTGWEEESETTPDDTAAEADGEPIGWHEDEATPGEPVAAGIDEPTGWEEEAQATPDVSPAEADDHHTGRHEEHTTPAEAIGASPAPFAPRADETPRVAAQAFDPTAGSHDLTNQWGEPGTNQITTTDDSTGIQPPARTTEMGAMPDWDEATTRSVEASTPDTAASWEAATPAAEMDQNGGWDHQAPAGYGTDDDEPASPAEPGATLETNATVDDPVEPDSVEVADPTLTDLAWREQLNARPEPSHDPHGGGSHDGAASAAVDHGATDAVRAEPDLSTPTVQPAAARKSDFVEPWWWTDEEPPREPPPDLYDGSEWWRTDPVVEPAAAPVHADAGAPNAEDAADDHGPDCECGLDPQAGEHEETGVDETASGSTSERLRRLLESWQDIAPPESTEGSVADSIAAIPPTAAPFPTARPETSLPAADWFEHPALAPADAWATETDVGRYATQQTEPPAQHEEMPPADFTDLDDDLEADVEPLEPTPWTLDGDVVSRRKVNKGALAIGGGVLIELVAVVFIALFMGVLQAPAPSSAQEPAPATAAAPDGPSPFAALPDPSATPTVECWLAVMGVWDDEAAAAGGVARLGAFGLTGETVSTTLLPGESDGAFAAAVALPNEAQAAAAIERAERLGFSGTAVETTPETCAMVAPVSPDLALGFADVPTDVAAHEAILWAASTGLLAPCNPPTDDRFCPDESATIGDFGTVTEALGVGGVMNVAGLAAELGLPAPSPSLPSPPSRSELAVYLWESAASFDQR